MAFPWAAIGSVVGGLLGKKSNDDTNKLSKEIAKNGITWRAADAKRAGIHPLAAIAGAGAASYQPIGGNPLGAGIAEGAAALENNRSNKGQSAIVQSTIEVNRAQADLLRAQTTEVLAGVRAAAQGHTTGMRNVSNPAASPMETGAGALPVVNLGDPAAPSVLNESPVAHFAGDAVPRSNIDNPEQAEETLMAWARQGSLVENSQAILNRNPKLWHWLFDPNGPMEKVIMKVYNMPSLPDVARDYLRRIIGSKASN